MTKLTLYDFPESGNAWKARQIVHMLEIPCEVVKMDGLKGACRTEAFKKKNVDQRLPLLELPDGSHLAESNAILFYLAQGSPLWPEEAQEQAQVRRWMFFEQNCIEAKVAEVRFMMCHVAEDKRDKNFEDVLRERGARALKVMDDHLAENDFFACNRFTIADISLYAYTHVAGEGGYDLSQFPNIQSWIKRIEATPRHIPFDVR